MKYELFYKSWFLNESVNGNPGMAGAGGILWVDNACWLMRLSLNLGITKSIVAELRITIDFESRLQ